MMRLREHKHKKGRIALESIEGSYRVRAYDKSGNWGYVKYIEKTPHFGGYTEALNVFHQIVKAIPEGWRIENTTTLWQDIEKLKEDGHLSY